MDRKCDIIIQTCGKWRDAELSPEALRWNPTLNYLEKWDGSSWVEAHSCYAKSADAEDTYLAKADAEDTYLAKADAEGTYLAQSGGSVAGNLTVQGSTTLATVTVIAPTADANGNDVITAAWARANIGGSPYAIQINTWNNSGFPGQIVDFYGGIDNNGHPVPFYWDSTQSELVSTGISLTNWHICDGTNGTPNLIGRVTIGASSASGATYQKGSTGGQESVTPTITVNNGTQNTSIGSSTLSVGQIASHNHVVSLYMYLAAATETAWGADNVQKTMDWINSKSKSNNNGSSSAHTHSITNPAHGHTASCTNIRTMPPFFGAYKIIRIK